jgi:hypothetical protein
MKKFIQQNAKSPNISFRTIVIIYQSLGTHIHGTANTDIFEAGFSFDSETKISYLIVVLADKNVGYLEISMNNP